MDSYEKIIDKNNGIIYAHKLEDYRMNRHDPKFISRKKIIKKNSSWNICKAGSGY